MKKLLGLASALVLTGFLSGCNVGYTPKPYQIKIGNLGYNPSSIPSVNVEIFAAAGAPDIEEVRYKAQFRTLDNVEFVPDDSNIEGLLFLYAHGGYACTTTIDSQCRMSSADVYFTPRATTLSAGEGSNNLKQIALISQAWVTAHSQNGSPTGVKVTFTFTGTTAKGDSVTWVSDEQFVDTNTGGGI
jgi:hypothetical protein